MAFSARQVQVCCALLPVMGFTAFPLATSPLGVQWTRSARASRSSPPCRDPSKFSLSSSRSPSPGPFPPCRSWSPSSPPSVCRFQHSSGEFVWRSPRLRGVAPLSSP
jgi:hypothetical protein